MPRPSGAAIAVALALALGATACAGSSSPAAGDRSTGAGYGVTAQRMPLTTDPASPVAHDTEVMALTAHAGRLFAATDQWEYDPPAGSAAAGQVLVKDTAGAPWRVFEPTGSLRVQALDSFPIPAGQGLGPGHALLVTQAIVHGRSQVQWLLDDADAFAPADRYALQSDKVDARSFGAHEDGGTWSVYAGTNPTGILRGTWSPTRHTLVFDPAPELSVAAGAPGVKAQKVTGFADCGGALYTSIGTRLLRRNDGDLPANHSRWALVYQAPAVGAFNSGLRGLTCVTHDKAPALLVSTEGNGNVYRFDDLPTGERTDAQPMLRPTLELEPTAQIQRMLRAQGNTVPDTGPGSIGYVIAAYNDVTTLTVDGVERQAVGFEWGYRSTCPQGRRCGPSAFGAITYDAAACLFVRTDGDPAPAYALRCLDGPGFEPDGPVTTPIRAGQAFVAIRTMAASPFGDGRLWYGGYDCNFHPADGTAWVAGSSRGALHPDHGPEEAP